MYLETDLYSSSDSVTIINPVEEQSKLSECLCELNAHYCSFIPFAKYKYCVINTAAVPIHLYQPANWLVMNYSPTGGTEQRIERLPTGTGGETP